MMREALTASSLGAEGGGSELETKGNQETVKVNVRPAQTAEW